MKSSQKTKLISFVAAGLFVLTGTYNSVVINSESQISGADAKFVKRLDEIYGVTVAGREVAASASWQKIAPQKVLPQQPQRKIIDTVKTVAAAPSQAPAEAPQTTAAVQEELSLNLVEVINPKKWQNGLPASQFSGNLATNNGIIEDLSVSLPNGENVSVSFSEMNGNVFEYDMNGDLYSGMMYQVDQNSYMVTLTNGPLEGTRLRFVGEAAPAPEASPYPENVADNSYGNEQQPMGNEIVDPQMNAQLDPGLDPSLYPPVQAQEMTPEQMNQNDLMLQQQAMEAQGMAPQQQTM